MEHVLLGRGASVPRARVLHSARAAGACLAAWVAAAPVFAAHSLPNVEKALSSSRAADRMAAAVDVRRRRAAASEKSLRQAFRREGDEMVRLRLAQALAAQGGSDAAGDLISSLGGDPSPAVRQAAAQELARYVREPAAVAALAAALRRDAAAAVRYACALSLALSDTPAAADALEWASRQVDPDLRRQAALSLRRHASVRARQALQRLSGDADPSVRRMATGETP